MTIQEFIDFLVPQAQKGYHDYGVFPSVTIAQAIWESGWGKSYLARTDYNLFGIKYPGNHDSSISISQGSWATDDGGYYAHYESWGDSCLDHGFFLANNSRYANAGAFTANDAYEQIRAIASAGYASDANYANSIISVINSNNLTQYDTGTYNPNDPTVPPLNPPAPETGTGKILMKNAYHYGEEDNFLGRKVLYNGEIEVVQEIGQRMTIKLPSGSIICVNKKYLKLL